ncbi:unnamed protein product [Adineta ricciae]|uniref:Uncharacterized protein n=1 Tax=Adineta ricciae TaxID=249248 RepID=A0A813VHJ3_ADIRI|nr:unnamed protein product [Adineta ricciae]
MEIADTEFCSFRSKTITKIEGWLDNQVNAEQFRPEFFELLKEIEKYLNNCYSRNPTLPKTQIRVTDYTSTGKSSLVNRPIGVQYLNDDDGAAPVRTIKSTHCPMQFDRREPFISSTPGIEIPVTLVNTHVFDKDRAIVNDRVKAGNYLDDI